MVLEFIDGLCAAARATAAAEAVISASCKALGIGTAHEFMGPRVPVADAQLAHDLRRFSTLSGHEVSQGIDVIAVPLRMRATVLLAQRVSDLYAPDMSPAASNVPVARGDLRELIEGFRKTMA